MTKRSLEIFWQMESTISAVQGVRERVLAAKQLKYQAQIELSLIARNEEVCRRAKDAILEFERLVGVDDDEKAKRGLMWIKEFFEDEANKRVNQKLSILSAMHKHGGVG